MRFLIDMIINKYFYRPYLSRNLKNVGINFKLGFMSEINKPEFFSIGDNFYSGPFSLFSTNKNNPVFIGDNVMFGPKCNIQGGNHDFSYQGFMRFNSNIDHMNSVINIEKGVWVGANTTIVSGADIGEGSIIGAMSLVNKKIPPFIIAAGNPAKVIRSRFSSVKQLEKTLCATNSVYSLADILSIHKSIGLSYTDDI